MKQFSRKAVSANLPRRRLLQFALLGAAACLLPACQKLEPVEPKPGDRFPDIALPDMDGHMTSFAAYQGVALVVNFWATWCEPCRREMPSLEKLGSLFSSSELRIIGVSVDNDRNLAREFCLRYKLTLPMMSDSDQALASGALRIPAFPATYLLRRDHTIAHIIVGARDWASPEIISEIEGLLTVKRHSSN